MIRYKDKIIAEPGYFIHHPEQGGAIVQPYEDGMTYTESPMPDTCIRISDTECLIAGRYIVRNNDTIKADLVHGLFSNDDQIAIMLNREESDEDMRLYEVMQGWRTVFSGWAHRVKEMPAE